VISEQRLQQVRADFPALQQTLDGKPPIYLDNACTSLVPQMVIDSMNEYYTAFPACGGWRSRHRFARAVSSRIDGNTAEGILGSRRQIQEFIHARSEKEVIFTSNTTQSINLVALGYNFKPGDLVLLSDHEHNSNLIPWLRLQSKGLIKIEFLMPAADGRFDLADLEQKCARQAVRLISLAYTSNLTGYTLPAPQIIAIAHRYGARVLLDGAQTLPHQAVDVQQLGVDFLAFSIHKMCGPKGIGILYARSELLKASEKEKDYLEPVLLGGGTVSDAAYDGYGLLDSPERFEAGVQNYAGQIAAGVAMQYLQKTGMQDIQQQVQSLNQFLSGELLKHYGRCGWFSILGPPAASERGGIVSFLVKRPNAMRISDEMNQKANIMIRDGAFCVHSYLNNLFGKGWAEPRLPTEHRMVYRVSLYFYNTLAECRTFVDTLDQIFEERCYLDSDSD
jgi:cysteine desulfurase / selenocysteine lyase